MAAHQAPLSLRFSRQEHWTGLPFPSPMHESESEVAQLCLTLSDPMDCSPPSSSIHGVFQARGLECVAIASKPIAMEYYLANKKTEITGLYCSIGEPWKPAKWKKPDINGDRMLFHLYGMSGIGLSRDWKQISSFLRLWRKGGVTTNGNRALLRGGHGNILKLVW